MTSGTLSPQCQSVQSEAILCMKCCTLSPLLDIRPSNITVEGNLWNHNIHIILKSVFIVYESCICQKEFWCSSYTKKKFLSSFENNTTAVICFMVKSTIIQTNQNSFNRSQI